jgi:hypothetical protein
MASSRLLSHFKETHHILRVQPRQLLIGFLPALLARVPQDESPIYSFQKDSKAWTSEG